MILPLPPETNGAIKLEQVKVLRPEFDVGKTDWVVDKLDDLRRIMGGQGELVGEGGYGHGYGKGQGQAEQQAAYTVEMDQDKMVICLD